MRGKRGVVYKSGPSNLALFFAGAAFVSWFSFLVASGFPVAAWVYYRVVPSTSAKLANILRNVVRGSRSLETEGKQFSLPPVDPALAEGHSISISSIGVDAEVIDRSFERYEEAIKKGVWRVPDFAIPEETYKKPMIFVAHRFGYLEWSNQYRRENSFFNLPKVKVGNEIEVVWDRRKYVYRITRVSEGEEIDDYSSDLILYTCKFLVSPVKIFVYAERVN